MSNLISDFEKVLNWLSKNVTKNSSEKLQLELHSAPTDILEILANGIMAGETPDGTPPPITKAAREVLAERILLEKL